MINDVYNLVQELLNKNGYGILSPVRFMLFAKHSQLKILTDTIDRYRREKLREDRGSHPDSLRVIEAIIDNFSEEALLSRYDGSIQDYHILPDDYMAFDGATLGRKIDVIKIDAPKSALVNRSNLLRASEKQPFGYIIGNKLYIIPDTIGIVDDEGTKVRFDEVILRYFRYPRNPVWTYHLVGGKPAFNISDPNYQDFELPESMLNNLVIDILSQAGLHLRDEFVSSHTRNAEAFEYNKDNQ